MQRERTHGRWSSFVAVALLSLAVLPWAAGIGTAASVPASSAASAPVAWAYGGQAWSDGGIATAGTTVTWNTSFGLVAIFHENNTSATTIELSEQRTVAVAISLTATGPNGSLAYRLQAVEVSTAFANLTRTATVTLANGSTVAAIGLLNASAQSNGSLAESLVATHGNATFSAFLNVSGHAALLASFAPALGLVPTNLSAGTGSWSSTSTLNASAAWQFDIAWEHHGPLGSSGNTSVRTGSWNGSTLVTLYGSVGEVLEFHDHLARSEVLLALNGPFGLRDGFVLVPVGFDLFGGGAHPYDADAIGSAAISAEGVFVVTGREDVRSFGAAQATLGTAGIPLAVTGAGNATVGGASGPGGTVTAQPESPSAAQTQAACLQNGCASAPNGLGPAALLLLALVAAAVVGAVAVFARRRPGRSAPPVGAPAGPSSPPAPPAEAPRGPTP